MRRIVQSLVLGIVVAGVAAARGAAGEEAMANASAVDAVRFEAGKAIAYLGGAQGLPACSACHGAGGEGEADAAVPRLAGLDATYLVNQLTSLADGTRANSTMSPIAKMLNPATSSDVAAYYASLSPPPQKGEPASDPHAAAGNRIALRGDWSVKLPPCASCHGANGLGVGVAFPPVAGQSAPYITNQLNAWRSGARKNDPMGLMASVASRMDAKQIEAVAAYYAGLPATDGTREQGP
jgi:cytochrome c553